MAALPCGLRAEDIPRPPPDRGMLILRNGQVLEGRITQADGLHVVDLPGGQIRVKNADVDMVCGSLEEGYARKRATIQVGDVHQHLELAQWCLRQGLLTHAADELSDAIAADPQNPMIGALRHRLKMAQEPPPTAEPRTAAEPGISNEELDRMVRGLPHGAVEIYTQSVQPVLMNHCTSSGCHGPQSDNGLRLFRIPINKTASRRLTQRNLASVLQYVDRQSPAQSRLLTAVTGPHGNTRGPIFAEHQVSQYQRLADWTNQFAAHTAPDVPASVRPQPIQENPTLTSPTAASGTDKNVRAAGHLAGPAAQTAQPRMLSQDARKAQPLHTPGNVRTPPGTQRQPSEKPPADAVPASHEQPADPFDPEVFNRRFAPKK